ncbi:bcl-2-like protein 11 [Odontesthes bonariensis]|uniref:bcl-2-like protein 11 n=1 Tax=Odontesthes bonariensis TaxID=219752 RepID=UPI003F58E988
MHSPSRPPSDGSTEVTATEGSGKDPPPVSAVRASAQTSRPIYADERSFAQPGVAGGEPDSPSWSRNPASFGVFRSRPLGLFPLFRRSSSGYFSYDSDSLPSSPIFPKPVTADKATQTPSPTGQVMNHALQRMAEAQGGEPGAHRQHGLSPNPTSTRQQNAAGAMQAEAFGRQLRTIGDDYNRLLMLRRMAGRHRPDVIPLNFLPHIHQEPIAVFCVGLLVLLMGRIMYLQGSTNSQDHSPV